MEVVKIEAQLRTDLGKKAAKSLRRQGQIPCNLYGGKDNVNFYAPYASFRSLIFTPEFKLAEIVVGGNTYRAILKDLQQNPVNEHIDHLDFQELVEDRKVKVEVPLKFKGTPVGAAMGGKVEQTMRKITLFGLPKDLPNAIIMDVSDMDFGSVKRISEIVVPNVEVLHSHHIPVARMNIPRAVKEETPATPAAAPAAAAGAKPAAGAAAPPAAAAADKTKKK